jgi:hypothetical protein
MRLIDEQYTARSVPRRPAYETVPGPHRGLARYFDFYIDERPHQSFDYRTPAAAYRGTTAGTG